MVSGYSVAEYCVLICKTVPMLLVLWLFNFSMFYQPAHMSRKCVKCLNIECNSSTWNLCSCKSAKGCKGVNWWKFGEKRCNITDFSFVLLWIVMWKQYTSDILNLSVLTYVSHNISYKSFFIMKLTYRENLSISVEI